MSMDCKRQKQALDLIAGSPARRDLVAAQVVPAESLNYRSAAQG